jgi:hypothetical protein
MARPMPEVPPITTATLPLKSNWGVAHNLNSEEDVKN